MEPNRLEIVPVHGPIQFSIRPPGSKSLTNRALILAALAQGPSRLTGVLDSVDTQVMIESLRRLGLSIEQDLAAKTISLVGCGGHIPAKGGDLYLENSGTSIRFLSAMCCIGEGRYRLDGNPRMRERPIAPLVKALSEADIASAPVNDYEDVANDPQVKANNYIIEFEDPVHGKVTVPGPIAQLSETPAEINRLGPELGQHTEEVLQEVLGYSWEKLGELRDAGVY